MIPPWLVDGRTLRTLSRTILIAAAVSGVGLAVCLGRAYWSISQVKSAQDREQVSKKQLQVVQAQVEQANRLKRPKTPDPEQAGTDFQSAAERAATESGAVIGEFDTNPEVQAYLSKYTNEAAPDGWKQVSTQFSITGTAQSVFDTLDALRKVDIPFEIDGIEINRTDTDSSGESTVRALIQTRVLMRA